jgi:nucleoid DNA-binding protein
MDKPKSLTMKEYIVRKLAVKMMLSEKLIDVVITDQFSEANKALKTNDSVEISGFGKFLFNHKKAQKKMEKMLGQKATLERQLANPELSEQKRRSNSMKLESLLLAIETLKPRITND